jgi:hypothetical protein
MHVRWNALSTGTIHRTLGTRESFLSRVPALSPNNVRPTDEAPVLAAAAVSEFHAVPQ